MKMRTIQSVASQTVLCLLLGALICIGSTAFAQNTTIFGPNVYVFTPSTSVATINSTLTTLAANTQFSTNRYQVFFEPGTYTGVESEVGYYEALAGLGETPTAVNISQGYLTVNMTDDANGGCGSQPAGCMTINFWRAIENMSMTVPASCCGSTMQWGVSQGASFRRMQINGGVELADSTCGETSGGFIADSVITGLLNACSQQQWYTRNSSIGSFTGNVWNDVFSGVSGAPPQSNPFSNDELNVQNTVLATTPAVREKPYLYMDSSGNYWVFSPSLRTSSTGTDWSNGGLGAGTSLAISTFLIATPSTTLATINSWLATSGHNLILTPGIYKYSGAIAVTNASTVVLGLGYADIVPQSGTAAITVADVNGVQLAGFLIDAGPVNSPILLLVGVAGTNTGVSHATNPTSISDVNFRIGGSTLGSCTEAEEIDSNNVIIDNTWIWRADHGNGGTVGWGANTCKNGLVVNGNNVTALGLAVEHFQAEQVVWNGNGGETIFYQSEFPYDVPNQAAWMNGTVDGYASYNVAPSVTSHTAYGIGVYSYFNQGVAIIANSGIAAPAVAGVKFTDSLSVWLNGSGQITHTIATNTPGVTENAGTLVTGPLDTATGPSLNVSDVASWVGSGSGGGGGGEGPYGGTAAAIPGTVMNENYDTGGSGVGYDVSSTNGSANSYRSDGIDLEAASSPATGDDLGWSAAGQWFRYTVNVATAGTYTVTFLVASESAITDAFHLSNSSGTNLTGSVAVPDTGGWQTWTTATASVTLPAGTQTLTLSEDAGGWNIDDMVFATSGGGGGGGGGGSSGGSGNFTVKNNCSYTIYPGIYPATYNNGGWQLNSGSSVSFTLPSGWNGRIWGRKGCNTASPAVCTTGSCGGSGLACAGTTGVGGTSLAEFNLNASGTDWYDVSYVDGFDNPIGIVISNTSCVSPNTCTSGPLTGCYSGDLTDGGAQCNSPCTATGLPQYCCAGAYGTPATCQAGGTAASPNWPSQYLSYVTNIHSDCPNEYAYAYDDNIGLHTCATGNNYTVTFCPNGSGSSGGGGGGGGGTTEGPYGGTAAAVPGTVMNENYDTGGSGVGYSVTSTNGSANSYRSDGIDLEAASSPATGDDLGWSAAGQWFRYTVNVSTAGTYTVSFLVASESAISDAFHLSNSSGTNLTGSVAVPNTGGWQTWATVTATATLPAGTQTLTLSEDAAGWNIDHMAFAASGGGGGGGSTLANGTYTLTPQCATALRLDDYAASTATGNEIDVYTANGTGAQNWVTTDTGVTPAGYYNLSTEGAYCLTASGTTSGSAAVLDPCAGTTAQAWEAVASGSNYILHPASNTALCLDVAGASSTSGTLVQVYTCNGTTAQSWAF
jgi:hypothetical protein